MKTVLITVCCFSSFAPADLKVKTEPDENLPQNKAVARKRKPVETIHVTSSSSMENQCAQQ